MQIKAPHRGPSNSYWGSMRRGIRNVCVVYSTESSLSHGGLQHEPQR